MQDKTKLGVSSESAKIDWYKINAEDVIKKFNVSPDKGLSSSDVKRQIMKYGLNKIKIGKPISWFFFFWKHLTETVSILLMIISIVALGVYFVNTAKIEKLAEFIIIFFIVILNASIGAHQEYKSEKTTEKLRDMMRTNATVVRNGKHFKIDSEQLVPGDVIILKTGDKIPADIRFIEVNELETKEDMLTGESKSVKKTILGLRKETPLAERFSMGYMNTYVTRGEGKGIVVGTGANTEVGKIARYTENVKRDIPFVDEVGTAAKKISYLGILFVIISSIMFLFHPPAHLESYGSIYYQIFMVAAALIIGAIPAALPVTVTTALSNSIKRLVRKNVLVKNMPLLETLGGIDVICTDKTGTLTQNKMKVKKIIIPGNKNALSEKEINLTSNDKLIQAAVFANEAEKTSKGWIGDPEDIGLYEFMKTNNIKYESLKSKYKVQDIVPFSSERKMMQTLVKNGRNFIVYTKGAPEVIIEISDKVLINGKVQRFTEKMKEEIKKQISGSSNKTLRSLAFSYREVNVKKLKKIIGKNVFLGAVGMRDPPKENVREAVQTCYDAGIEIKMITGDNVETATAIAKECGFRDVSAVSWEKVKNASDNKMKQLVRDNNVFARIDPEDKMRLVKALHAINKRVAITGDGVNDTPAIEEAEVGISMGKRGSDISKEAADMILLDDSFSSIKDAIKEGRTVLSNVRKVVNYLMTANLFEITVIIISSFFGFMPFVAIQLLWINFATDIFPAIGLGMDPSHPNIMKKDPTGKKEKLLTKRVWYLLIGIGMKKVVMVFVTFFAVLWISNGSTTILGVTGNLMLAQTSAFVWLGMSHIIRVVAIRWDEGWKWRDIFINKWVNYSLIWPVAAKILIIYGPLAAFFYSVPLPAWVWGIMITTILISVVLAIIITEIIDHFLGKYGKREY